MTESMLLWRWDGPPVLEASRVDVDVAGQRWTQVVVTAQGGLPGVVVIAETDGCVALVRQFRPAVGNSLWELPRGFGEEADGASRGHAGLKARRSAAREMAEETGMRLQAARYLGSFFPDSGLQSNSVSVVHGYVDSGEQRVAGDEVDEVRWVKVTAIGRLISDGTLQDGITLGALAVWRLAATLPSA